MSSHTVSVDLASLRKRAREHMDQGAVTAGYAADRTAVVALLNDALATELVCALRYRRHHFMARGIHSQCVAAEFLAHANEELGHADRIAERIVQLGGEPDFDPRRLATRSHSEYISAGSLAGMIRENLVAERIAIDTYRGVVRTLGDTDPTTRRMIEDILAVEEQHADELSDLLVAFPADVEPVASDRPADDAARRVNA